MIVNNLFHSDLLLSQSIHHMPFEFIFPNIFQFTCVQFSCEMLRNKGMENLSLFYNNKRKVFL